MCKCAFHEIMKYVFTDLRISVSEKLRIVSLLLFSASRSFLKQPSQHYFCILHNSPKNYLSLFCVLYSSLKITYPYFVRPIAFSKLRKPPKPSSEKTTLISSFVPTNCGGATKLKFTASQFSKS